MSEKKTKKIIPSTCCQTLLTGEGAVPVPVISDVGWHDFVISHLDENELFDGIPRMDGLRRLVELLVGKINRVDTNVQILSTVNHPVIVVTATVELSNGSSYSAASDASFYSVAPAFRNRLTAVADNRAKAKVYREILRLGNMSTSEEVSGSADLEDQEAMVPTQKSLILRKAKELNVDINKVCDKLYGRDLDNLTHSQAGSFIKDLSDWAAKRKEMPVEFFGE
jgi:hypothetical protein